MLPERIRRVGFPYGPSDPRAEAEWLTSTTAPWPGGRFAVADACGPSHFRIPFAKGSVDVPAWQRVLMCAGMSLWGAKAQSPLAKPTA